MKTLSNTSLAHLISKIKSAFWPKEDVQGVGTIDIDDLVVTDKNLNEPDTPADAKVTGDCVYSLMRHRLLFTHDQRGIWANTEDGHTGGDLFPSDGYRVTDVIDAAEVVRIRCVLHAPDEGSWAGIAFYDANMEYLGCVQGFYYDQPARDFYRDSLPTGTAYLRFCSLFVGGDQFADIYVMGANERPVNKYWAVCGDSITNANHGDIYDVLDDDPYCPFDGYPDVSTYKRMNYAYYIAKQYRLRWANYGYGGTVLHHCEPKAYSDLYLYPFVDTRMTQLKEGIDWDYITIFFGWNDCYYGPIYQRDLWLTETYGEDIGYPVESEQIGASGFATQAQKDACDAATGTVGGTYYDNADDYFFACFVGTINDTTKNTWMGAWNNALEYLMTKYTKAKILIVAPYVSEHSAMVRDSVHAIAEKWGVTCFDFEDLPYWYWRTHPNNTELRNTEDVDGFWYTQTGVAFNATVDGYNTARMTYDGTHPSNLGYQTIAGPIGDMLLNDPENLNFYDDYYVSRDDVVQGGGNDTNKVISQAGVTGLLNDKEDAVTVLTEVTTPLIVSRYYRLSTEVGTQTFTLPTLLNVNKLKWIVLSFTTSSSPAITITTLNNATVLYDASYSIAASTRYELTCMWNGSEWIINASAYASS